MTRVATFAVQQLALSRTTTAQSLSQDLQIQVSSGKESRDYAGIAPDSRQLINFETLREQALRFTANIDLSDRRLDTMESTTAELFGMTSDLRILLMSAVTGDNVDELALPQQARQMLEQVAGLLNSDQEGRYLFAGTRTDTPPIDLDALLNPTTPLVDALEFSGAATTSGTGITAIPGIVSVRVPSGSNGDAFRLTYDGAGTLNLINLASGAQNSINVPAVPALGTTTDLVIPVNGTDVKVTIDDQFALGTAITTQPITGTVAGGPGAVGTITLDATLGDISQITTNVIDIASPTNDASNITLTLASADGNFVATGVDFESATGARNVTLTNATTGAQITLSVDVTTVLDDATPNDPGTAIDLGDALVNIAATAGAQSPAAALPGEPGYDPANPSFYRGDQAKLSLRADQDVTISYGVTAIESGFEKLVRALYITMQAGDPAAPNLEDLNGALDLVNQAIDEIPDIRTEIGTARASLEDLKRVHDDSTLLAERTISDLEDADLSRALTLLAQTSTQIEASFATLARLSGLTILEFI